MKKVKMVNKITVRLYLTAFFILVASFSMVAQKVSFNLHENWKFRQGGVEEWLPAQVPGSVHLDLLANEKIADPYYRTNEMDLQWIGQKDWEYSTHFEVSDELLKKENVALLFQGLDTYADVYLNDSLILSADNMHRTWQVACKPLLKKGTNQLRVYFHSVFSKIMPVYDSLPFPFFQFANNDQTDIRVSPLVRKAGYHFGWDWGPRFVTAGLWKEISLLGWDKASLEGVHIATKEIAPEKAKMLAIFEVIASESAPATLTLEYENHPAIKKEVALKSGLNKVAVEFEVSNPKLWWSNGLGAQNLYAFKAGLVLDGKRMEEANITTGIRTIEVVNEKDAHGKSLYVVLNGVPVFMKGANYIPNDNFMNRVSDEKYEFIIKSAADANMNMLRLWGGGFFEKDIFYELCDKYGLLVWQDMLFACATYPGTPDFLSSVKEEAKDNVKKIRNHPSVALYNGNNEVEIAYHEWGWKKQLSEEHQAIQEAYFRKLFYETIPEAISSVDTTRYYHETSPNSGYQDIPISEGDVHLWSVWHGKQPFEEYNAKVGRFMSEYGFQSYPEMATIKSFTLPEDRDMNSEVLQAHQKCMADEMQDKGYGNRLIKHYMDLYYQEPKDFESYVYVSQVLQAKGIKMALESHRRNMPYCMGSLYWQLNDCWPVASWSSIDYYGRWKALHYQTRDAFKEVLVSPVVEKDTFKVYVVSDRLSAANAELSVELLDLNGKKKFSARKKISVVPNGSKVYYELANSELLKGLEVNNLVCVVKLRENNQLIADNIFHFVPEKELLLKKPEIKMVVSERDGQYFITLNSRKMAKSVFLNIPDIDGLYSHNYFDLIPGETKNIVFTPKVKQQGLNSMFKVSSLFDSYSSPTHQ